MITGYEKVRVTEIPIGIYEDMDNNLHDNGYASDESYGARDRELMLNSLTARQRRVAFLLADGYSRIEIAEEIGVCTQAIHQIVLRIRKRLATKAGVSTKGWKVRHGRY